jgi:hypothetical protein
MTLWYLGIDVILCFAVLRWGFAETTNAVALQLLGAFGPPVGGGLDENRHQNDLPVQIYRFIVILCEIHSIPRHQYFTASSHNLKTKFQIGQTLNAGCRCQT